MNLAMTAYPRNKRALPKVTKPKEAYHAHILSLAFSFLKFSRRK